MASSLVSHRETRSARRLLWAIFVACAFALGVGGALITLEVGTRMGNRASAHEQQERTQVANRRLRALVVRGGRVVVTPDAAQRMRRVVLADPDLLEIQVWTRTGLLHSTRPARRRAPVTQGLLSASHDGTGSIQGVGDVFHVYVPILARGRPVGAFVLSADARPVNTLVADTRRSVAAIVAVAFLAALAALAVAMWLVGHRLVFQGDALDARSHELLESYRELEQSSLEAIETLNATVEAKDPYTAGHSLRVRRIALAIGRELQLPPKRIGALAVAALFHDVGKIGVPDDILTKPDKLTHVEAEIMRRHAERGGEIVGKLSRHTMAVPAIRHHHEQWNGGGYPDRLRGEEIPVEAAIIGLADAWDAMTTNRPYRDARPVFVALEQIRAGRGVQFSPAVVDAFLEVVRKHPEEVVPPGEAGTLAAVG